MTAERRVGKDRIFRLAQGDITRFTADAVVNAANEGLAHGGGVAGAIVRAGGPVIQEASYALAPVPTGEAVITSGGRLPAKHVIHAVGPRGGMRDADRLLESAVRASLRVAEENGLRSIAFPAISTGIFGYPLPSCARIMTRVCLEWLEDPEHGVREITVVLWDDRALEAFERALNA
jgi:O-acetyl-ADP-ribose deacetylase (regulator of RNase III)